MATPGTEPATETERQTPTPDPLEPFDGSPVGSVVPEHETGATPTPPKALLLSGLSLVAAAVAGTLWPRALAEYAGLVWVLALVPVFLLAYYRGWKGAAVAALAGMVALVASELVLTNLLGRQVDWWVVAVATTLLIPTTLGTGALSEALHRKRELASLLAHRDPLTRLANRRLLREHAHKMMALSDRQGIRVAVLSVDLVGFHALNEELGHEGGDRVLVEVARRLRRRVRDSDTVARIGGDEFAVFLSELDEPEDVRRLARRIQKLVSLPLFLDGRTVHVDAVVGAAIYPDHAADFDRLLSHATVARREARQEEDDVLVRVFAEDATPGTSAPDVTVREDLEDAIAREELELHYQPIRRLEDGVEDGGEALVRWDHPDLGLLTAGDFIPTAEEFGLIRRLDRLVLKKAIYDLAAWQRRDETPFGWVTVNLAPASFQDPHLADHVGELLEREGVSGHRLVLEITERAAIRNFDRVSEALSRVKEHDVRIAIDDFGTGHSALAYLEQISVDLLKLDMLFVQKIDEDDRQKELVNGIVALGRRLGIEVVAEGVETNAQYRKLSESRCDFAQGYYVGRPAPVAEPEGFRRHRPDRRSGPDRATGAPPSVPDGRRDLGRGKSGESGPDLEVVPGGG